MSYSIQSYIFSHIEYLLKSLNRVISTIQEDSTCSCANLEDGGLDNDHDGNFNIRDFGLDDHHT